MALKPLSLCCLLILLTGCPQSATKEQKDEEPLTGAKTITPSITSSMDIEQAVTAAAKYWAKIHEYSSTKDFKLKRVEVIDPLVEPKSYIVTFSVPSGTIIVRGGSWEYCEEVVEPLPEDVKIQINVPDEPPPSKTKCITLDVQVDRNLFFNFYKDVKQIGMCSPSDIQKAYDAHEVICISFWGEALKGPRKSFYILKNQRGVWLTAGYGDVQKTDISRGFPEYVYPKGSLSELQKWYDSNVLLNSKN